MSPTSPWTTGTPNILWIHKLGTFLYEEWLRSEWLFFPFIFLSVLYWGALDKCTTSTYSSSLEYAAFCPFSLTRGRKDTVEFSLNPSCMDSQKKLLTYLPTSMGVVMVLQKIYYSSSNSLYLQRTYAFPQFLLHQNAGRWMWPFIPSLHKQLEDWLYHDGTQCSFCFSWDYPFLKALHIGYTYINHPIYFCLCCQRK